MRGDRIFLMAMIEDVLGKVDPATVVWSHDGKPTLRITPDQAVVLFRNISFEINEDTTKESLVILRELGQIIAKPLLAPEPRVVAKPAPGNSKVVAKDKATASKKFALNNDKAIVEEEAAAVKKPVPDNTAATPKNEVTSSDPGTLNSKATPLIAPMSPLHMPPTSSLET